MATYKIDVIKPTVFKRDTKQAVHLRDDQQFVPSVGSSYIAKAILEDIDTNHVKCTLEKPIKGYNTWYLYKDHIELDESKGEPERQPEDAKIATPTDRGRAISLPGDVIVNLKDPIIPGGHFYWYEATHNGSRIPRNQKQVNNIKAIAALAEEIKTSLTKKAVELGKLPKGQKIAMIVTSWFRPEPYNGNAGGARQSEHLEGRAIDFYTRLLSKSEIWDTLNPWFPGGLGNYRNKSITHIDSRGYRARFH